MRLIDADALIAEYDRVHVGEPGGARKLMKKAPTVDAVPVIRCKDCMYWDKSWQTIEGCHYCGMIDKQTEGDFYCADGEREEE